MTARTTSQDRCITALVKGDERFVFVWDRVSRAELLRTIGRFAGNPSLSLSWSDAAVLFKKIRETEF